MTGTRKWRQILDLMPRWAQPLTRGDITGIVAEHDGWQIIVAADHDVAPHLVIDTGWGVESGYGIAVAFSRDDQVLVWAASIPGSDNPASKVSNAIDLTLQAHKLWGKYDEFTPNRLVWRRTGGELEIARTEAGHTVTLTWTADAALAIASLNPPTMANPTPDISSFDGFLAGIAATNPQWHAAVDHAAELMPGTRSAKSWTATAVMSAIVATIASDEGIPAAHVTRQQATRVLQNIARSLQNPQN